MEDWTRGPPCEIDNCRSRWFVERSDGRTYCRHGHQVEGQIATQVEEFELGGSHRSRAVKRTRKKKDVEVWTVVALSGREAAALYLEAFQLVLWRMSAWLRRNWCDEEVGAAFEECVKDLWALRVEMCKDLVQEEDTKVDQLFVTQHELDSEDEQARRRHLRRATFHEKLPKLVEALGLCYLSCVLLKIPVCSVDVEGWVLGDGFVYWRAVQALPMQMRHKLPWSLKMGLEARTGLGDLEKLHSATSNLVFAYDKMYSMEFPPISHKLLLYRFMVELALPLPVFSAVFRLNKLLDLDFYFMVDLHRFFRISHHPEILLMALLTVSVKLIYPFDTEVRNPTSTSEPAALVVDWDLWNDLSKESRARAGHAHLANVTEAEVFAMTGVEMDKYLDWFGKIWTEEDTEGIGANSEFRRYMYRMFPVASKAPGVQGVDNGAKAVSALEQQLEILQKSQAQLVTRSVIPTHDEGPSVLRPGMGYAQYRCVDDVPERAKPFLTAAATLVGLRFKTFLVALFQVERKLQKWSDKERRMTGDVDHDEMETDD